MHESHIILLLIEDIKKKATLKGIDDSIIKDILKNYFNKNKKSLSKLVQYQIEDQLKKSAEYKEVIKTIRAKLYKSYGMFQIPKNADEIKQRFLRKLSVGQETNEDYKQVFSLHLSTKERFQYYPFIYQQIFKKIKPKIILDLGCGLNPLSYHYMNTNAKYIASDIDKVNLVFIQKFFELSGIDGKILILNLENETDLQKLAFIDCDVCFMFKLLETDKRLAEPLVTTVNAKIIVASFSTISLTGKIMSSPEREWFEKMLSRLKYKFSTFKTGNEIFYIIRKS
ncbi:MAG: hypothetical protein QW041_03105 [Candidatus Pacearchaeota archaeon]